MVILVVIGVFSLTSTMRSSAQAPAAATKSARNAAIVAATVAVLKETSEIRELSIIRPVRSGAQTRNEIERMIIRNVDEQTTPAEMHATELALKKLGLAPAEFQYRQFIIKLLTEQVAGYYDTKAQQFYLADWIELEGQKPVMAHELTHALQDQHFNLRRFEHWPRGDSDAELAVHALIEGDATLSMTLYMAKNPLVALAFLRSLAATNNSTEQFQQAPRALRESLVFPYEQGSDWTTTVYKRGGWKMVSDAFTKLPQSSEQILHPDKYFAYESPIKLALPDLKQLLGPSWKRIDYDVNGEWSYYLILDQFLQSPVESKKAAAGWGGDRYALYEGQNPDRPLMVQLTAWDTEDDAREFFDAYIKRTDKRYADSQSTNSQSPDQRKWHTAEGDVVLERRGTRVLVIEGVETSMNSKALVAACWGNAR
jgi:hypothetical protein